MGNYIAKTRIETLDIIRGFALIGVCVANMFYLYNWWYILPSDTKQVLIQTQMDQLSLHLIESVVDGKFFGIFTILFGIGLAISRERYDAKRKSFMSYISKRSTLLIILGMSHIVLLNPGGILLAYGVCGFCASFFIKSQLRLLMILIPLSLVLIPLLLYNLNLTPMPGASSIETWSEITKESLQNYGGHQYLVLIATNIKLYRYFFLISWAALIHFLMLIIGPMLAGIVLWRTGFIKRQTSLKKYLTYIGIIGLLLIIQETIITKFQPDTGKSFYTVFSVFGYVKDFLYSLLYFFVLLLICKSRLKQLLRPFKDMGKISVTNYMIQAIISAVIFYGVGMNQVGCIGPFFVVLISTFLSVAQILFSHLWLKRFDDGPIESLIKRL